MVNSICPNSSPRIACAAVCLAALASPVQAAGTFTQTYAFTGGADGALPYSSVTIDAAGNIYGEASAGANLCADAQFGSQNQGCGTVYKISPAGQLTTLVTFTGPNGANGDGQLALIGNTLYGTTTRGGMNNYGVIFSVNTDGTGFQLIHQFTGPDGAYPIGPLIKGAGNVLYGVAYNGGPYSANLGGSGVLFKVNPNGSFVPLHNFHKKDGANPNALVQDAAGTIYGSTYTGGTRNGGTVFSYVPASSVFTSLYSFSTRRTGLDPYIGSIDASGNIYGATAVSGTYYGGTLFEMTPTASGYNVAPLYAFGNEKAGDGSNPASGPTLLPDGSLIGTTSDTLYLYNNNVAHSGSIVHFFNYGYSDAQPVTGPDGTAYGAAGAGGTTPCLASNGTTISASGCGFIYSETRPGAP